MLGAKTGRRVAMPRIRSVHLARSHSSSFCFFSSLLVSHCRVECNFLTLKISEARGAQRSIGDGRGAKVGSVSGVE